MPGTITYPYMRNKVCGLRLATYANLKEAEQRGLAIWITKAYRYVYEEWAWEEAWETDEYPLVDGKVTGLAANDFNRIECWTADPRPVSTQAVQVRVRNIDADGVWLNSTAASVWIRVAPHPPVFAYDANDSILMLRALEEPVALLALSFWFTAEQEHEQAARVRQDAEEMLDRMTRRLAP